MTQRSISSTAVGILRRVVEEQLALVGVQQQLLHAAADDVARGLVAADEDQQRLVQHVVGLEPVAVDLGVHEHAHEVVGRVLLALRDRVRAERGVLLHRVHRAEELLLGRAAALRAHHVVGPAQQVVAVFGRDAEHVADQDHRQRRGDVADEVALALLADAVDDRVALVADVAARCRGRGRA